MGLSPAVSQRLGLPLGGTPVVRRCEVNHKFRRSLFLKKMFSKTRPPVTSGTSPEVRPAGERVSRHSAGMGWTESALAPGGRLQRRKRGPAVSARRLPALWAQASKPLRAARRAGAVRSRGVRARHPHASTASIARRCRVLGGGFDSRDSGSLVSIPCNRGTRLGPIGESPNIVVTIAALGDPCLQS